MININVHLMDQSYRSGFLYTRLHNTGSMRFLTGHIMQAPPVFSENWVDFHRRTDHETDKMATFQESYFRNEDLFCNSRRTAIAEILLVLF